MNTLAPTRSFADVFGGPPAVVASAPGRVNLLGEHTDYNDGYVLPTAIPQLTVVSLRLADGARHTLYAAELNELVSFGLGSPPAEHFATYVHGCLRQVAERGADVPPLDIHVESEVPMGVGLSSSAALEVAMLRALRQLLQLDIDDVEIARMAQRAEIEDAGVNCGIMDQMASSLADVGAMLFLDTRTLQRQVLPLPAGTECLVIDSGVPRTLAGSKYNERRSECEAAARALGVPALRDVADPAAVEALPEPLRRRARHVVSENARVLQAVRGVTAEVFGQMMNASHASLRDDYEVSIEPLDRLVGLLQAQPDVLGARLTGAGFGGACVALCREGRATQVAAAVLPAYAASGGQGQLLVPAGPALTPA